MELLDPTVSQYLSQFLKPVDSICEELEAVAQEEFIPIMDSDTAAFMRILALSYQPKYILEIGTAIGYSAYLLSISSNAKILTIEMDPSRYQRAVEVIKRANLTHRIVPILADALDVLPMLDQWMQNNRAEFNMPEKFDWIYLDAAKGQYAKFLELLLPRLSQNGLLFSDNILFQGLVSGPPQVKHKLRTLVTRLRDYNQILADHPLLETAFLPIGDGLAISTKKQI